MPAPKNANESYCTFTLASDVTAGGLPSEAEIAKDLESNDDSVSCMNRSSVCTRLFAVLPPEDGI
jgi:hypothetical protein